jgi:hypothetical protein
MTVEIKGGFVNVTVGNELYVYFGGSLLYKRWIDQGKGRVFYWILNELNAYKRGIDIVNGTHQK